MSKFVTVKDRGSYNICRIDQAGRQHYVSPGQIEELLNQGFAESCELRLLRIQHAAAVAKIHELTGKKEVTCG